MNGCKYILPLVYIAYNKLEQTEEAQQIFGENYLNIKQKFYLVLIGILNIIAWIILIPISVVLFLIFICCLLLALPLIIFCSPCILFICYSSYEFINNFKVIK